MAIRMIETVGKRNNSEVEPWYRNKVLELAGFLIKKHEAAQAEVGEQEPLKELEEAVR